jgi:fructoselysine 6-kinase
MGMTDFDIATVGDNCIDRYLLPIGMSTVGGNALNVAVHLRHLGRLVAYFGAIGDDKEGRRTRLCLEDNRIDTTHLRVLEGKTAFTNLDVDDSGDRIIAFEDFGVCRGYRPTAHEVDRLHRLRHVHLGWLDDGGELKRSLAQSGVSVSQDLAVNAGAEDLTIAFASAGSDRHEAERLIKEILSKGARLAVVTRGSAGSIASDGSITVEMGVKEVEVLDTTGAGDTFFAGFIDAYLNGRDLHACLAAGSDVAAGTCMHLGGFPQTPVSF